MQVSSGFPVAFTPVPQAFIDGCLSTANGEYVKIYLLLLRHLDRQELSLSLLADKLDQTEKDVRRALKYWEKEGWLSLEEREGELLSLELLIPEAAPQKTTVPAQTAPAQTEPAAAAPQAPPVRSYSAVQMKSLMKQDDFSQLIFVTERYLGRPLTKWDTDLLAYLYDELHFPGETLEYLVEYSVGIREKRGEKNDQSIVPYMEKIALGWHQAGALSLEDARKQVRLFSQKNGSLRETARALGIRDRSLTDQEEKILGHWLFEKNTPPELMLEACQRTIRSKNKPDFAYLEGILKRWENQGLKTLEAVAAEDERFKGARQEKKKTEAPKNDKRRTDYDAALTALYIRNLNASEG